MLTALEIKGISFSNALRGYKIEEVEVFLDKIEADYIQFERIIKDYESKIDALNCEIESFKNSQNSIQNVLLSAQKLADQIVNEAKEKSEEIIVNAEHNISAITAQEKELAFAFEQKANERKALLEKELAQMVEQANLKANAITAAAEDSVKRQQVLFDKLKLEIAAFKSSITSKYKEHLSILQEIPDAVKMSPEEMAEIISAKIDSVPAPEEFLVENQEEVIEEVENENQNLTSSKGFSIEEQLAEEVEEELTV